MAYPKRMFEFSIEDLAEYLKVGESTVRSYLTRQPVTDLASFIALLARFAPEEQQIEIMKWMVRREVRAEARRMTTKKVARKKK